MSSSDKCSLLCVDPTRVAEMWPHVSKMIRAAMFRGGITDFADVEHSVFNGGSLVWIAWNGDKIKAAAVTELSTANGNRYCTIVACGGEDRHEWLPLLEGLEKYARNENCYSTRLFGRRGWTRVLPDYKTVAVILEKELH